MIRVGTASWSDPGFVEDWYPEGLPAAKRLAWYAEHFKLVEVNSTFYSVPHKEVVARWCEQTPRDFVFDVKLHQLFSKHSTQLKMLPKELRSLAKHHADKVEVTPELEEACLEKFLDGIQPLYDQEKMGALLLQMTPGFGPRDHDLEELDRLLGQLKAHPLAVELRNRGWFIHGRLEATKAYFNDKGVALVCVDAPSDEHFTIQPNIDIVTTPELAYLRAHGRNARGYITGLSVATRFDYKYSDKEIGEIAARSEHLATLASDIHIVFNNNKSNYAPLAAAKLQQRLANTSHKSKPR